MYVCVRAIHVLMHMCVRVCVPPVHRGQGQEDKALSTARERVAPHLGTTLGPDAGRHGGRLHKEVMRQAVQDVQGSAVAINGSGAGNGMSAVFETHRPSLLGPAQYDLQRQIIEVLSERMVDDGGQVRGATHTHTHGHTHTWAHTHTYTDGHAHTHTPHRLILPRCSASGCKSMTQHVLTVL